MKQRLRAKEPRASKRRGSAASRAAISPLLPVAIPHTGARLARGIRAGRWVFATGQAATDHVSGLAPDVEQAHHPLNGESRYKREARRIYRNVTEVLAEAGVDLSDVVRVDQYYTSQRTMHPYHEVRHEVFGSRIPPSTSNLHQRFSRTGQTAEIQIIAAAPGADFRAKHETFKSKGFAIPEVSGYSPALRAGDFLFLPGHTAESLSGGEPSAIEPQARDPRSLWRKWPVKLETDFIIKRKLIPSLEAAGVSIESVAKAQVYLTDVEDVPGFNEVWLSYFKNPPAITIIATSKPGFAINDLRVEINTISVMAKGKTKREVVRGPEPPAFDGWVSAVKCGDLLFLSGLMAVERGRLIDAAVIDTRQPFYGIPVKAELRSIVRQAEAICRTAGTSLSNTVRIQQFHTDLADLPAAIEVWDETMNHAPLPLSPIEVAWLPVPGARVQVDLWVYVPG
jgi:enamine deaminase RidA (YjgF/YER057c/UK114 family)